MTEQINKSLTVNRWKNIEFNRYGIVATLLIFHSCLASIAVYYILDGSKMEQFVSLSLVAFTTMAANASIIMVLPMKWIIRFSTLSVIVSLITWVYAIL